jgi:Domain of unknown function (DUF3291)
VDHELAQVNVSRLLAPLDSPQLADFAFTGRHVEIMRRRREWFARAAEATTALWWVPAGHRPTTDEAEEKIRRLRVHGPTTAAFTFRHPFPPPDRAGEVARSDDGWLCPA